MSQNENKDLGTQGQEDSVKGKLKEAAGKVQSKIGDITDNPKTGAKGDAKQVEGKTQATVGNAEQKVDNALDPNKP